MFVSDQILTNERIPCKRHDLSDCTIPCKDIGTKSVWQNVLLLTHASSVRWAKLHISMHGSVLYFWYGYISLLDEPIWRPVPVEKSTCNPWVLSLKWVANNCRKNRLFYILPVCGDNVLDYCKCSHYQCIIQPWTHLPMLLVSQMRTHVRWLFDVIWIFTQCWL